MPTARSLFWTTTLWTLPLPIGSRVLSPRCQPPPLNSKSSPTTSSSRPRGAWSGQSCLLERPSPSILPQAPPLESTTGASSCLLMPRPFLARAIPQFCARARPSPSAFPASRQRRGLLQPAPPSISSSSDSLAFPQVFFPSPLPPAFPFNPCRRSSGRSRQRLRSSTPPLRHPRRPRIMTASAMERALRWVILFPSARSTLALHQRCRSPVIRFESISISISLLRLRKRQRAPQCCWGARFTPASRLELLLNSLLIFLLRDV